MLGKAYDEAGVELQGMPIFPSEFRSQKNKQDPVPKLIKTVLQHGSMATVIINYIFLILPTRKVNNTVTSVIVPTITQLPTRTSSLKDNKCLIRTVFKDVGFTSAFAQRLNYFILCLLFY